VVRVKAVDNERCGCVMEMESWHWWDATSDRVEALASVPTGEGCRCCTVASQDLLALY
jgi:hypothetical protein